MKLKTVAMTGMMSLAGLGLIGVGAHAAFTTTTTSNQTISSGSLSVVLYVGGVGGTQTITLTTPPNVGSSFTTGDQQVQMYNNGNVAATEASVLVADNGTNGLDTDASICIASNNGKVIYNGSFLGAIGTTPYSGATTIGTGSSDYYYVNVYAGSEPTMCGNDTAGGVADPYGTDSTSTSGTLGQGDQGESFSYSLTVNYNG